MARKNKQRPRRAKRNTPAAQRSARMRRNRPRNVDPTAAYALMVADPCNGPLLQGFYSSSEGMLNKTKSTFTTGTSGVNGYVLWDPTFTSGTDNPGTFNCVVAVTATATANPLNTSANPFGSSAPNGDNISVGAGPFCQTDTVADARCIGACIKASYTGRMDASSGIVCVVDNIPAEAVLGPDGVTPVSVQELFNLSTTVRRFGTDPIEVKYRPHDSSSIFRSNSEGVFEYASGQVTTLTAEAERAGSRLMGFAFKGVTDMDEIMLEFHQNIEWRPNVDSGFVTINSKQLNPLGHAQKILRYLDKNHPHWWSSLEKAASSVVSDISKMAFTGIVPIGTEASWSALLREAPLALKLL